MIRHPKLAAHACLRWDPVRGQHQLVHPEGLLVLNDSAAAIVEGCDGRSVGALMRGLQSRFGDVPIAEVTEFLDRLVAARLLSDG